MNTYNFNMQNKCLKGGQAKAICVEDRTKANNTNKTTKLGKMGVSSDVPVLHHVFMFNSASYSIILG